MSSSVCDVIYRIESLASSSPTTSTRKETTELQLQNALAELQALKQRLKEQDAYLQEEIHIEHNYRDIVGQSEPILKIVRQIDVVGPTDAAATNRNLRAEVQYSFAGLTFSPAYRRALEYARTPLEQG